ncbi:MAG TPA: PAS domain S-box protein, partial [Acidobacteriota bacterium]|nr:PAS domain S-box protein [Acidobacteriota bacterium]
MNQKAQFLQNRKILIVEDEALIADELSERLSRHGALIVDVVDTGMAAIRSAEKFHPDLIMMDIRLKAAMTGIEAAEIIHATTRIPVVFLTAHSDWETVVRAKQADPYGYLLKPFTEVDLLTTLQVALHRHNLERLLIESEQRYEATLASLGEGVISADNSGRITFMNQMAGSMTQWPPAEALGHPIDQVLSLEDGGGQNPALLALQTRKTVRPTHPALLKARDGGEIPVAITATAMTRPQTPDHQLGTVVVFRDVTERRQSEARLQASESRFHQLAEFNRAIMDNMGEGLVAVDRQGLVTYLNPAAEQLLGFTAAELLGCRMHDMTHYQHPDGTPFPIEECAGCGVLHQHQSVKDHEDVFIRKGGHFFPVAYNRSPLFHNGEIQGLVVTFRDITQAKEAREALRASESRYRAVVEDQTEFIVRWLPDGTRTFVNQAYARYFGQPVETLIGTSFFPLIRTEEEQEGVRKNMQGLTPANPIMVSQHLSLRGDGRWRYQEWVDRGLFDDTGLLVELQSVGRDVHERVMAEQQLRESQRQLDQAQQVGRMGSYVAYPGEPATIDFSKETCRIFGIVPHEFDGKMDSMLALVHPEDRAMVRRNKNRVPANGHSNHLEFRIVQPDGQTRWVQEHAEREEGTQVRIICVVQDITERKQAEAALRTIAERLQLATRSGNIGIWDWDIVKNELSWDDRMYAMYGISQEGFGGVYEAWLQTLHPDDHQRVDGEIRAALRGEREYGPEFRIVRGDGTIRFVKAESRTFYNQDGQAERMIGITLDITERKQAEILVKDERNRLNAIFDTVGDPIFLKDNNHRIITANQAFYDIFNQEAEAVIGQTLMDNFPENEREHFLEVDRQVLDTGQPDLREETLTVAGFTRHIITKKTRYIEASSGQKFLVGSIHDITERKQAEETRARLEQQLQQTHKMESLGRLAGGVAHDFNNMLTAILGHTELALFKAPPGDSLHTHLNHIQTAAQHSAALTRQLLAFARKQTIVPQVLDLNETISTTLKMVQQLIGKTVQLIWLPGYNLWPVKVDPSQLEQILANLCINARDAMGGAGLIQGKRELNISASKGSAGRA